MFNIVNRFLTGNNQWINLKITLHKKWSFPFGICSFLCCVIIPPPVMIGTLPSSISHDKSITLISSPILTRSLWFTTTISNHDQTCFIHQLLPPPTVTQYPSFTSCNWFTSIKHYQLYLIQLHTKLTSHI